MERDAPIKSGEIYNEVKNRVCSLLFSRLKPLSAMIFIMAISN